MFSGKTEELLRRLERHRIANRRVVLLKPDIDTRKNITHSGKEFKPIIVPKGNGSLINEYIAGNDVVGIDEIEFFGEEVYEMLKRKVQCGTNKTIIVAGLDMDFRGTPFGIVPNLLAIADEITKLHAVCESCHGEANVSHRLSGEKEQVIVGGKGKYKALCWKCYSKENNSRI